MQAQIQRTELAPGFSIARVLTGLWQIADMERDGGKVDRQRAVQAMVSYADAGFTTFDMADHYGSAEEIAGLFAQEYTGEAQLFTKWVPKPGPVTSDDVRTAVQRSLDRMQKSQIDLLQFHAWNYADPVWLDCLFWLQELKEEGLIRHLGLTNVDTAHLRIVVHSGIDVVSNQVCFSLLDQRAGAQMQELCLRHGIKILAFGTVAGGFLTEKWLNKPEPSQKDLPTWSQNKYKRFIDGAGGWVKFQNLLHVLQKIATRHEVSIANIACRYILEKPAVAGIIIGARLGKSEHIEDNRRLFQFQLDAEDHKHIAEVLQDLDPIPVIAVTNTASHHFLPLPVI